MWFEQVLFFAFAFVALAGALGVVMLRNPFFAVLSLVLHLVALAVLFLLLRAQFLAAAQVVVYAGAVVVLYVFVVAYIGAGDDQLRPSDSVVTSLGPVLAVAVGVELSIAIIGTGLEAIDSRGADIGAGFGSPGAIGSLLLSKFLVPFEAASYLLLLAAVGAVVLARRRRGLEGHGPDDVPATAGAPVGREG